MRLRRPSWHTHPPWSGHRQATPLYPHQRELHSEPHAADKDDAAPAVDAVQREATDEREAVHGADHGANGHVADAGADLGGRILRDTQVCHSAARAYSCLQMCCYSSLPAQHS